MWKGGIDNTQPRNQGYGGGAKIIKPFKVVTLF